ncbi:MAG: IS110 family transposase, partial [Actinomycetota bacterium]|nr:IS110 family transposase [Actinomycetota bacterium]
TLTDIPGIGDVGAATILSIVDHPARFPTKGHFAAFIGTAPLDASSGDVRRHRLSRRGNRQMNKVLHMAARRRSAVAVPGASTTSASAPKANSTMEALRALKRQLSDVVYRRLLADQQQRQAARGGQMRTRPKSA